MSYIAPYFNPIPFLGRGPSRYPSVSRLFTEASTTQGLRGAATTEVSDLAAYSIAFWFYPNSTPASDRLVFASANFGTGGKGWAVQYRTTKNIRLQELYTSTDKRQQTTNVLTLNTWTHIVCRSSDTTNAASSTMDFVINGVQDAGTSSSNGVGTHTGGTALAVAVGTSSTSTLQASPGGATAYMGIWGSKIPDAWCTDLFNGATPMDFAAGLVRCWRLDGRYGHLYEPDLARGGPLFAFSTGAPGWFSGPPRITEAPRMESFMVPAAGGATLFRRTIGALGTRAGSRRVA